MQFDEITEEGWYWTRMDEFRPWTPVYVKRRFCNTNHPKHNTYWEVVSIPTDGPISIGLNKNPPPNREFIGPH